jgi:N-acetylmuramoyl-L-alanine amidase
MFTPLLSNKDIIIDIHFNSSSNKNASGTEVFIPSKYLQEIGEEIESKILSAGYKKVPVVHSSFSLGAPLYGSAAIILNRLFAGEEI